MAVINIQTAEAIGATEAIGTLTDEQDLGTASAYYLVLDLTNTGVLDGFNSIELCHFTHYTTLASAAVAPAEFRDSYLSFRIEPPVVNAGNRYVFRSDVILAKGQYLYTWLNVPKMGGAISATLRAVTI